MRNNLLSHRTCVLILSVFAGSSMANAVDLSVRAYLDKTTVGVGEQFTISLELSGSDAEDTSDPETPILGSFATYLGSGSSRSVQIVNGRVSSTRTINYYFQATAPGKFEIPSITVRHQNTEYRTEPISLDVVQNRPGSTKTQILSPKDLFLRASASRRRVYQNEPVLLSYRIYTRVEVPSFAVSRLPDKTGFWVENLQDETQRPIPSHEVVNGIRYSVATIQQWALFPTAPGTKTLEPLEVECEVRVRQTGRRFFDDIFTDPFGRTVRHTVRSEPVTLEVLPLPEAGKPRDFGGAVGSFQVRGEVDKTQVRPNDVVTLKVQLEGSGNIRTLPDPSIFFSTGLEAYDPKITEKIQLDGDTIRGTRDYEYLLVPRSPGTERVGPIQFPYFDPGEGSYKTALLDEIRIDVAADTESGAPEISAVLSKEEVQLLAQGIRFIRLDPGQLRTIDFSIQRSGFFWGILLIPVLGVFGGLLYRRHRDRLEGDPAYARKRRARRLAGKRLATARTHLSRGDRTEFYAECGKALSGFAADKLNVSEAGVMSDQLMVLLSERGASVETIQEYFECMGISDRKRFSPVEPSPGDMDGFLRRVEGAISKLQKELSK